MSTALSKSASFVSNYGTRDAFFRTIQCAAKLLALLSSKDSITKRRVLNRIATLLSTSRRYFSIGNVLKEMNNFKVQFASSQDSPEYILHLLKSGGMVGFFAMDNLNAITSLTSGANVPFASPLANVSFLVAVLSSIGIEYLKEDKDEPSKRYVRYGRIAADLIIVLNALGIIPLPEELSTLAGGVSALLCCVEALQ